MEKGYWFYIYPNVYVVEMHSEGVMLYNTETGTMLQSNDAIFMYWVHAVHIPKNIGVIFVSKEELKKCNKETLDEALNKKMINYLSTDSYLTKPINLLPILNLQKDFGDTKKNFGANIIGDSTISYLSKLNIYLLSESTFPEEWQFISQQLLFPICSGYSGIHISCNDISKLLVEVTYSRTKHVNILGGSLHLYRNWKELDILLKEYSLFNFHLWLIFSEISQFIDFIDPYYYYDIIIIPSFTKDINSLKNEIESLTALNIDLKLHIYITSEEEYISYNQVFHEYNIEYMPLYSDENTEFFKEYVYLKEEDILEPITSMRKIFCNQKVNSNFFGSLNVYPDGSVKATCNTPILGNINESSLKHLIFKELTINTAWRKIRNNNICNSCFYRFICPPPSLYESTLNKENLCLIDIKKKKRLSITRFS